VQSQIIISKHDRDARHKLIKFRSFSFFIFTFQFFFYLNFEITIFFSHVAEVSIEPSRTEFQQFAIERKRCHTKMIGQSNSIERLISKLNPLNEPGWVWDFRTFDSLCRELNSSLFHSHLLNSHHRSQIKQKLFLLYAPSTKRFEVEDTSPKSFLATTLYCPASSNFPSVIKMEYRFSSWKTLICGNCSSVISSPPLYHVTAGVGFPRTRTSNLAALPSSMERSFNGAVNEGASPPSDFSAVGIENNR